MEKNLGLKNVKSSRRRHSRQFTPTEKEKIQELVKSGLSLRCVSRELGLPYSTVHGIAACYSKRQSRIDLSALTELERGYIIGAFIGDGSRISESKSGHYGVKFALDSKSDKEIANFLQELFVKADKRVTLYTEETWFALKVYSLKLLEFLLGFVKYEEIEGKKRKILREFENWPLDFKLGFISGLIDTDGFVHHNKQGKTHFGLSITTMNSAFVKQLTRMFEDLGVIQKFVR